MNYKTNQLRDAIFLALLAGSMSATAAAQTAQTPQPNPEKPATPSDAKPAPSAGQLDVIVVTGSRINLPGLATSSPVTSVSRQVIDQTQPVSAEEFIRNIPGVDTPIGPGVNNGSNGGSTMSMRGLGSNRSLVLVDGRRMVPYTLNGQVDTNTIPVALIQRVDMLTGGASTVYGADAVSGVANFVLKKNFTGVEIAASTGQAVAQGGGAERRRADITGGFNFADNRGNVVVSLGRTQTMPLMAGEREIGKTTIGSTNGLPLGSNTTTPAQISLPAIGLASRQIDIATGSLVPRYNTFNTNPPNYFITPMNRDQATFMGRFEFDPHFELYTQAFYTKSKVQLSLASSGTFGNSFNVPIGNPYMPAAMRQQICTAAKIPAANCVVGSTTMVNNMTIDRRFTEYGPRLNELDTTTKEFIIGGRGLLAGNWNYDVYYSWGKSVQDSARVNWGSLSKLRQALQAVSTTACMDPANNCVPINVFGPEGSITADMLKFLNVTSVSTATVQQKVLSASVSGDLGETFKSPFASSPIGMAFGAERRNMSAFTSADIATSTAREVLGTGAPTPNRSGSFTLNELYAESIIPLISERTAFNSLNLELGYRHSAFQNSAGTKTRYNTWKYGLSWSPVEDITFRGMVNRAVRAPNINELFAPVVTGLANLAQDPCGGAAINTADMGKAGTLTNLCQQTGVPDYAVGNLAVIPSSGQVNVRSGGNPVLAPEIGNTKTLGFVLQPTFIKDFALTFDYWNIKMTNQITSPTPGDMLDACYNPARNSGLANNAACSILGRDPVTGLLTGPANGILLKLDNLGVQTTHGYDLGLMYLIDMGSAGRLSLSSTSTWTREYKQQVTPTSINRDCLGYYSSDCGVGPYKFKSTFSVGWGYKGFDVMGRVRHVSALSVEPEKASRFLQQYRTVPAYNYFDASIGYKFSHSVRLTLSANNLFDKKPPFVGNNIGTTGSNGGNTFPQLYDVVGRYLTLGVNVKL